MQPITQYQLDKIPEYEAKWNNLVLSTAPVDKPKAESLINQIYAQLGYDQPKIIWVGSPWEPIVRANPIGGSRGRAVRDGTFHSFNRKIYDITWKRLGLRQPNKPLDPMWAPLVVDDRWGLEATARNLGRLIWLPQFAGFHYLHYWEPLGLFDWVRQELNMKHETEPAALTIELAQNCAWWRPHKEMCFISERPTKITYDNPDGPAIVWGNKNFYLIDGVHVPDYIVTKPHLITAEKILLHINNAEVRRIAMNRYQGGIGAFIKNSKAVCRDHDEQYGTLWHIKNSGWWPTDHIFFLEVINRTPEPDGHFKHYFLRMPPNIDNGKGSTRWLNTAKEAVAWSFNQPVDEYEPMIES